MSATRRLLLICPSFFGYHESILGAAEAQGFEGQWVNARASESVFYKAGLKVAPNRVRDAYAGVMQRQLDAIVDPEGLTDILVIKGDGLLPAQLERLRARAPKARVGLYLWDSLRNNPGAPGLARYCDRVSTFDAVDARAQGWDYLPLFSRSPFRAPQDKSDAPYDWCFVGTIHGDRFAVLERLAARHPELRAFTHCYVPGKIVHFARGLRQPGLWRPRHVHVTTQLMPRAGFDKAIAESRAVVDIEHPSQTGLTMRTIETLLSGTKLITTNAAVRALDIYDPARVQVIDRHNPQVDAGFFETPFPEIPTDLGAKYQVADWFSRLAGGASPT